MDKTYDVISFLQNRVVLRKPGVANFAGIIKIAISLIKKSFKTQ